MSGIVFFMLVGRFFQDKTYNTLTFSRDYTSYFPIAVTVLEENGNEKQVPVSKLKVGQRIKIHSEEIIPADSILFLGKANIDYSFVTGESVPIQKGIGEIVYAGGKQIGGAIELEIVKEVSQSYLTSLWENETFSKEKSSAKPSFIHSLSRYFTLVLFSLAIASAIYWQLNDPSKILDAVTSILIVACPCALLLSATFTNGNLLQRLQKLGFYARNANVLEQIGEANCIVFDKTGTLTAQKETKILYEGAILSGEFCQIIRSLAYHSSHPMSKAIMASLPASKILPVKDFGEQSGLGIKGMVSGNKVAIGSAEYIFGPRQDIHEGSGSFVAINNQVFGKYSLKAEYRQGLKEVLSRLRTKFSLSLMSGDNSSEKNFLATQFGKSSAMFFEQKPHDKLEYIRQLQRHGNKVIMIGDGLNDAGALKQSDVGIAITDNINNFSPGCDVIMEGKNFSRLDSILSYCRSGKKIIIYSFILSVIYNLAGLYFAFFAKLEPVIAAILMPVSSISIILFTTGMSSLLSLKMSDTK
jgi:Cu+-exporting ATPase